MIKLFAYRQPPAAESTSSANSKADNSPRNASSELTILNRAAAFGVIILGLAVLYYGKPIILPLVLAMLITYALEPAVRRLHRLRIPRGIAAMATIVTVYAIVGFTIFQLRGRARAIVESLPEAAHRVHMAIQKARGQANGPDSNSLQQAAKEIQQTASVVSGNNSAPAAKGVSKVQIEPPAFNLESFLWSRTTSLLRFFWQGIVVSFLVFFLLASGDLYKRKLVRLFGSRLSDKRLTVEVLHEIDTNIERFLLVQILTSAVVGVATWVLLALMHVDNAAIWALSAGVLNSIPYFGAIFVSAGLALVSFLQFGSVLSTIEVAGGAFIITSLEGMLLTPALMGKASGINQVAMFVALLFWGWMWGIPGTLLAVPIMMIIKTVCQRIEGLQRVGEFLNEH